MVKDNTYIENRRRIYKAMDFVVKHLDQTLNLDRVAKASHLSPYHLHRLFHQVAGETLNGYVTRKKMEKAVETLICQSDLTITDVAEAGGFSSPANFSKAFKSYFDITPRELRDPNTSRSEQRGRLYRQYGKAIDTNKFHTQAATDRMVFNPERLHDMLDRIVIADWDKRHIIYHSHFGGYDWGAIGSAWERLLAWADGEGLDTGLPKQLSLFHDNPIVTPQSRCRYDAALVVDATIDDLPFPYAQSVLDAGRYAAAPYEGPIDKMLDFFKEVNYVWLPKQGLNSADGPLITDYIDHSSDDDRVTMTLYFKLMPALAF